MTTSHTETASKRESLMSQAAAVEDNLRQAKTDARMWQRRLDELNSEIAALDSKSDEQQVQK